MIFPMVIANILGILLFLYIYWKRLKEDYSVEKVFNSGFIVLISIILAIILSRIIFSYYWFWIILILISISEGINVFKLKLKFFESLDALVISLLPWFSLYYLVNSISNSSLKDFINFWLCLVLIFLFLLFNNYYKSFNWYKSGKIGFSGLTTLGIFFILRSVLIINFESYISGSIAFIAFLLLYKLSRTND